MFATFDNWRPNHIMVVRGDQEIIITKIGWECPVCHRGLSPDITICEHDDAGIAGDKIVSDESIRDQMFSGLPINFDLWEDLQWYEDDEGE